MLQDIAPTNIEYQPAAYQPARRAPSRIEAVGIVIPARNESETIAKCISNIFAAHSHSGWRNSLWIVVVADACTDTTAKVARSAIGAFGEVLEIGARSLQTAHRIGASTVRDMYYDAIALAQSSRSLPVFKVMAGVSTKSTED